MTWLGEGARPKHHHQLTRALYNVWMQGGGGGSSPELCWQPEGQHVQSHTPRAGWDTAGFGELVAGSALGSSLSWWGRRQVLWQGWVHWMLCTSPHPHGALRPSWGMPAPQTSSLAAPPSSRWHSHVKHKLSCCTGVQKAAAWGSKHHRAAVSQLLSSLLLPFVQGTQILLSSTCLHLHVYHFEALLWFLQGFTASLGVAAAV